MLLSFVFMLVTILKSLGVHRLKKNELSTQIELLLRKRKTDYKLERNFLFELAGIIFYFTIN